MLTCNKYVYQSIYIQPADFEIEEILEIVRFEQHPATLIWIDYYNQTHSILIAKDSTFAEIKQKLPYIYGVN